MSMASVPLDSLQFHYLYKGFYFPKRIAHKRAILRLFKKEGFAVAHINFIFCDDQFLLAINREHLGHNTFTDIITFPFSPAGTPLTADIYISIERVRENSQKFQVPFLIELRRVLFHGALHLCGYKDKTKEQIKLMRLREDYYLERSSFT